MKTIEKIFKSDKPLIARRCVHLDLKGVPPTPERLIRLLKFFSAARYNSVLVEWEDSFPWTVDKRFRSETAYAPDTVKKIVEMAEKLGLELIPLVQCLGHMETPLRLPEYAALREVPYNETCLNPLAAGARDLISAMIDDVLALMPNIKHFHLGGDEAWSFGTHPETKKYIAKHGKGALYLHHIEPLLDKLIRRKIRPLLWHDMMRDWKPTALVRLARKADLVVWGYRGHPDTVTGHYRKEIIERFVKHNMPLWGATAYKGADGYDSDLPDTARREENALAWTEMVQRYGFRGIIATAWSRYRTNGCQNEPIDGALDSALNVGVILYDGKPPEGGIEACRRELVRIGEGHVFRRARNSLEKMSAARDDAWKKVRMLRQLILTLTADCRRRPDFETAKILKDMQNDLKRLDTAADALRKVLAGLVETVWIERYLAERIEPLREEFSCLEARLRQINPVVYNVLF